VQLEELARKPLNARSWLQRPGPRRASRQQEALMAEPTKRSRRFYGLLWLQVGCVLAFFGWAAVFEIDVASYAMGQVIPAGQVKRVQHLEGGIVREIRVTEGQRVNEGDVIAELQRVSSDADVSELRSREASLEGRNLRLSAILDRAASLLLPPALVKDYPAVAADARLAFDSYRERFQAVLKTHESRVAQRRAEIEELKERISGLQSRSKLISEQVRISTNMLARKLTNEYEHLQLLSQQAQIDADRDTTVVSLRRASRALEEATAALAAFRSEEDVTLRKELFDTRSELASIRERLRKPTDSVDRTLIRAPASGTVMTLFVKNAGAVIAPGGLLATLVPEGEALLVESKLPIAEIGFIRLGSPARLSLAGGTGGFSTIDGEVIHISPDATLDEKTGTSHYVVRLRPAETAFHRAGYAYPMKPGVQVTAAILTGNRTVLATLFDTFFDDGVKPLAER
jgi:adhesin transport system membrane fusion protein